MRHICSTFIILICIIFALPLIGQAGSRKVLQIETYGKAATQKIYIGDRLTYQLRDAREYGWYSGIIEDFLVEDSLIVFKDRFININNIYALKYKRGWPKAASTSLTTFGLGWSALALVGTATDGDPDTSYQWSDAIVTGSSIGLGLAIQKLFEVKQIKFKKRKRLRLLDLTVVKPQAGEN